MRKEVEYLANKIVNVGSGSLENNKTVLLRDMAVTSDITRDSLACALYNAVNLLP